MHNLLDTRTQSRDCKFSEKLIKGNYKRGFKTLNIVTFVSKFAPKETLKVLHNFKARSGARNI